jgi:hypothetical protein
MQRRFWTITGAPLWRDWVAGVGLIAVGWAVHSSQDKTSVVIEVVLACAGGAILVAALIHGLRTMLFRGCDNRPAA